eukprot:702747_1
MAECRYQTYIILRCIHRYRSWSIFTIKQALVFYGIGVFVTNRDPIGIKSCPIDCYPNFEYNLIEYRTPSHYRTPSQDPFLTQLTETKKTKYDCFMEITGEDTLNHHQIFKLNHEHGWHLQEQVRLRTSITADWCGRDGGHIYLIEAGDIEACDIERDYKTYVVYYRHCNEEDQREILMEKFGLMHILTTATFREVANMIEQKANLTHAHSLLQTHLSKMSCPSEFKLFLWSDEYGQLLLDQEYMDIPFTNTTGKLIFQLNTMRAEVDTYFEIWNKTNGVLKKRKYDEYYYEEE